jgi:hypothetical protein
MGQKTPCFLIFVAIRFLGGLINVEQVIFLSGFIGEKWTFFGLLAVALYCKLTTGTLTFLSFDDFLNSRSPLFLIKTSSIDLRFLLLGLIGV